MINILKRPLKDQHYYSMIFINKRQQYKDVLQLNFPNSNFLILIGWCPNAPMSWKSLCSDFAFKSAEMCHVGQRLSFGMKRGCA